MSFSRLGSRFKWKVGESLYMSWDLMIFGGTNQDHMGLFENRVYSQWNSHLIGIMISKTSGFRGIHDIFRHTHITIPQVKLDPNSHARCGRWMEITSCASDQLCTNYFIYFSYHIVILYIYMGCPGPKPKSSLLCLRYTTLLKGHFAAGDLASAWRIVEEMQARPSP